MIRHKSMSSEVSDDGGKLQFTCDNALPSGTETFITIHNNEPNS